MTIQANQLADLVLSTLPDLGRLRYEDIASKYETYHFCDYFLNSDVVREDGGVSIRRNAMVKPGGNAAAVGLYATDNTTVTDAMAYSSTPWTHFVTSYAIDHHEVDMNNGDEFKILDILNERRNMEMLGLLEMLELMFWGQPSSSSDVTSMYGLQYWLTAGAGAGDTTNPNHGAFNGGNNSNFASGPGGLNCSTVYNNNWNNYTNNYANPSFTDLIPKLRDAFLYTGFKSPKRMSVPEYSTTPGDAGRGPMAESPYVIYTPLKITGQLEQVMAMRNDAVVNNDLSFGADAQLLFRRVPMYGIAQLDAQTKNPIYMLNRSTWEFPILKGWNFKEYIQANVSGQHNVTRTYIDLSANLVCLNRRKNALLQNA